MPARSNIAKDSPREVSGADHATLLASEQRYRDLVRLSSDAILVHDGGKLTFINDAGLGMLRAARPDQILGRPPLDFFHARYHAVTEERFARLLQEPCVLPPIEKEMVALDGTIVFAEVSASSYLMDERLVIQVVCRDLTQHRLNDDSLRQERNFSEAVINSLPGVLYLYDRRGKFLRWSRNFERVTGYTAAEVSAMHPLDFFPPGEKALAASRIEEVFRQGRSHLEAGFLRKDGQVIPYYFTGVRASFEGKTCLVGVGLDVSARHLAEQASTQSEARYRTLFEYAPDGILIADAQSNYLDANPSACRMLGYTREEFIGLHASDIVVPDEIPHIETALATIKARLDYHREWLFRRKDGSTFPAEVMATVMPDGQLLGVIRDVSEGKQARQNLALVVDRLKLAVKAGKAGTWDYDLLTGHVDWDEQMLALYGKTSANVEPGPDRWYHAIQPEDRAHAQAVHEETLRGGRDSFETEFRIRRGDDGTLRHIRAMGVVLREESGLPIRMTGINWDVTEERLREEKLNLALAQQKELAEKARAGDLAKSEFLAVMSHEVRTPLNSILGFSELLSQTPDLPPASRDYAQTITSSGEALLRILDDVLDFSRLDAGRMEIEYSNFSPREILADIQALLAPQARERQLALEISIDPQIPARLKGDPGRLRQILLNLVGNALKFTERGSIHLSLRPSLTAAAYEFSVKDTGPGIAPEQLDRIFQPFTQADSSISRRHGGSGMGLSISRRLAELMSGSLTVRSRPGLGAEFIFKVPLRQAAPDTSATSDLGPENFDESFARQYPLRLLVVEDDKVNLKLILALLQRLGYQAFAAKNGREAVQIQQRQHVDCILMDLQMPEMDGMEATQSIRNFEKIAHSPQPAFISALTANIFPADRQRCFDAGMNSYLNKPIQLAALASTLREASSFAKKNR